jgi:radical SAM protein with 4Fe4S-binding SPASM domain
MECLPIPQTGYSRFSNRIFKRIGDSRIPFSGSIEITERCNLHCLHCFINRSAGDNEAKERELTYQELCKIIDQIVDKGCLWLLLTGGEPSIRPDFLDIYTYAKKKGLLITLFTNGTMITQRIADYLAEWRPFSIEITLYGATKETYESITGVPGSYAQCIHGIELLLEHKLPLKLKTMVMTINKQEIRDLQVYAGELGSDFRFDPVLNLRLDGSSKPSALRLPPEDVVMLDLADTTRMKEWKDFCDRFVAVSHQSDDLFNCGAGFSTFHIDSYGELSVCIMARTPSFNLRAGTFHEGWHNFLPGVFKQKWLSEAPCKNCNLISLCGQCPGWSQMEHGDPQKPVEYLCQIAHMRAEAFGLSNLAKGG